MRLWHNFLLKSLPRQLLLTQHRQCCALRGKSWGRATGPRLRWLWSCTHQALEFYHLCVMDEMERRGWKANQVWRRAGYRGKRAETIPDKWIVVPDNWPSGTELVAQQDPRFLQNDLADLRAWVKRHPGRISAEDLERLARWI